MNPVSASNTSSLQNESALREMVGRKDIAESTKAIEATRQFEASLVRQMLDTSLKPMFKGVFDEDSQAHEMYRYFWTNTLADKISDGGGLGMSNALQSEVVKFVEEKGESGK